MKRTSTLLSTILFSVLLQAQPNYRTFDQAELSLPKETKAGRVGNRYLRFIFHNTRTDTVWGLHVHFSRVPLAFDVAHDMHLRIPWNDSLDLITLSDPILPDSSVAFYLLIHNSIMKYTTVEWWWWLGGIPDSDWQNAPLSRIGPVNAGMHADGILDTYIRPNAGNVRDYLYKRIITRPDGVVLGIEQRDHDSARVRGWIRYVNADRRFFPHSATPRCLDEIVTGLGGVKPFVGQLRNPHVPKHNNLLLGDLHALKLAVIANDYGVTEPDTPATRLGDLIYSDPGNPGEAFNNLTVRQIAHLADSALTYCPNFDPSFYGHVDSVISRINNAFNGPYTATSFQPLRIAGRSPLPLFLHPNPAASPPVLHRAGSDPRVDEPDRFALGQNFPNPFNPLTTIEFELADDALVTIDIYDILGVKVATLASREHFDQGANEVEFDGSRVSSGVYFYRIRAETLDGSRLLYGGIRKMILLK